MNVPGDKSISHRVLLLAALAEGATLVYGLSDAQDVTTTVTLLRELGVIIERVSEECVQVNGVGLRGLRAPDGPLDCKNSGTTLRLLAGILCAQAFSSQLVGDVSLSNRPMQRIVSPLSLMGADIAGEKPPLSIASVFGLQGISYVLPVASAQVKSAILLAALFAQGKTVIEEPVPTRNHTERLLQSWGVDIQSVSHKGVGQITVKPVERLYPKTTFIPGDLSSAMFLIVAITCLKGRRVHLKRVGVNPTRMAGIHILQRMGARIHFLNQSWLGGEPVADMLVESAGLRATTITEKEVAGAIDELPVLLVAAACAMGETKMHGVAELRVKECDRLQAMQEGLTALGVTVNVWEEGISVTGAPEQPFCAGAVCTYHDHRIAMAFGVAGLLASGPVVLDDRACVEISFPEFWGMLGELT